MNLQDKPLIEYNPESKNVILRECIYHVTCVSAARQGFTKQYGHNEVHLDLSSSDDKAMLYGCNGSVELTIKPSALTANRQLINCLDDSAVLEVGNLRNGELDGKPALIRLFEEFPDGMELVGKTPSYVLEVSLIFANLLCLARQKGIVPSFPESREEIVTLMKRDDFSFGKDYSDLYSIEEYAPAA